MSLEPTLAPRYDAVVVGARCAGAATAMLLARRGLDVLVVERGRYGTDSLSTHALMRGAVAQLSRWGLLDRVRAEGTPLVRSTTFHYGDEVVPIAIKPRDGVDGLYAPRRYLIDRLLVDAARDAGADVRFQTTLVGLRHEGERVSGVVVKGHEGELYEIDAGLVVGADGGRSAVARMVGAEPYRRGRHSTGTVFGYWPGLEPDGYHWYFRPGMSAGAIPTNNRQSLVFVTVPTARFRETFAGGLENGFRQVLGQCAPELVEPLAAGRRQEPLRGFRGACGHFRQSNGPGWALVGDAGYFRDPLTAHGMTDAFIDAEVLADAVVAGGESALPSYQRLRDERASGLFEVTDAIASFDWDIETIQRLHHTLGEEMKRDLGFLWGAPSKAA